MKCEIRYAPKNLNEVIYPNIGVERRIMGYASKEIEGHIVLYGPNGTGKTSIANLLAHQIGNQNPIIDRNDADELISKSDLKMYLHQCASFASMTISEKHFLILNEFDCSKKNLNKFWTALDSCGNKVMAVITTNHPMEGTKFHYHGLWWV